MAVYAVTLVTCFIVNLALEHHLSWFFVVLGSILTAFCLLSLPLYLKKHRAAVTLLSFWLSLLLLLLICAVYTGGGWFFVTMWAVTLGFSIVFLPFVLPNLPLPGIWYQHKAFLCIAADTLLLFVLLASALHYTGNMSAYFTVACPIAAICLAYVWGLLLIIRYLNIHPYFRTAAVLGVSGTFNLFINSILDVIINHEPFALRPCDFRTWSEEYINGNTTMILFIICILLAAAFTVGGIFITVKKRPAEEKSKNLQQADGREKEGVK